MITVLFVVLTVYQPISWKMEKAQNAFLIEHYNTNGLEVPFTRRITPPQIYAEIQVGRQRFFDSLVKRTPLIPTVGQHIGFFTTLIISIILVLTWRYRRIHKFEAISDYQLEKHKIQTLLALMPSVAGYGFGLLFVVGLVLIRWCWENPNCEGNKLVVPLVLSIFLLAVTVLLVEFIFWYRHLKGKFNPPPSTSVD